MRAVAFRRYGGPEVLRAVDMPLPEPREGEVLVEVAAIGVSLPVVRLTRGDGAGGGVALPCVPGGEVAGTVAACGTGAAGWGAGQRVAGIAFSGAYAEYAAVPARLLTLVPEEVDDALAVTLVRSGQVALGVLRAAALQPGDGVLVTAAASGAGHLAVQLAAGRGASRVVAAVSTAAKTDFLRNLGATDVLTYSELAGGHGDLVDIVLDGAGGPVQAATLRRLAPLGRLVSYNAAGEMADVNQLRLHGQSIIGFAMAHLASRQPDIYARHQRELWDLLAAGRLNPAIDQILPLDQAAQAHRIIESRQNCGKIVLTTKT